MTSGMLVAVEITDIITGVIDEPARAPQVPYSTTRRVPG
jgi:hypothetical protein